MRGADAGTDHRDVHVEVPSARWRNVGPDFCFR